MSTFIPTTCIQWDRESHELQGAILASQWYNGYTCSHVVIVKLSMWGIISQANYRLALLQLAHTFMKSPWYSLTFSSCHRFSIGLASGLSGGCAASLLHSGQRMLLLLCVFWIIVLHKAVRGFRSLKHSGMQLLCQMAHLKVEVALHFPVQVVQHSKDRYSPNNN